MFDEFDTQTKLLTFYPIFVNYIYFRFQIRYLLAKTIKSAFFKKERNRLCIGIPKILEQNYKFYFSEGRRERRACPGIPEQPRYLLMEKLVQRATGRTNVCNLFTYGCWCGPRGHGKYVDNFD